MKKMLLPLLGLLLAASSHPAAATERQPGGAAAPAFETASAPAPTEGARVPAGVQLTAVGEKDGSTGRVWEIGPSVLRPRVAPPAFQLRPGLRPSSVPPHPGAAPLCQRLPYHATAPPPA